MLTQTWPPAFSGNPYLRLAPQQQVGGGDLVVLLGGQRVFDLVPGVAHAHHHLCAPQETGWDVMLVTRWSHVMSHNPVSLTILDHTSIDFLFETGIVNQDGIRLGLLSI